MDVDAPTIGAVVGVVFGCAWAIAGAMGLPHPWRAWTAAVSITIPAALCVALIMPHAPRQSGAFRGRVYGVAVAFEVAGTLVAVWLLNWFSLERFLMPAIGFIVGLHFVGMWKATDRSAFLWIAGAMCIVCGFAAFLPGLAENGIDVRQAATGMGCALVLWCAGAATLFRENPRI
jgi:hypothetical protein